MNFDSESAIKVLCTIYEPEQLVLDFLDVVATSNHAVYLTYDIGVLLYWKHT